MPLTYKAAVLHAPKTPLAIETMAATGAHRRRAGADQGGRAVPHRPRSDRGLACAIRCRSCSAMRPRASSSRSGRPRAGVAVGDHVVLSWNPHCGHCFYCDRDLPILCEELSRARAARRWHSTAKSAARLPTARELQAADVPGRVRRILHRAGQQAIVVPKEIAVRSRLPDRLRRDDRRRRRAQCRRDRSMATAVMVIGCGAVGLAAVQGARLGRRRRDHRRRSRRRKAGARRARWARPTRVDARTRGRRRPSPRRKTGGRGVDVVLEAAGSPRGVSA